MSVALDIRAIEVATGATGIEHSRQTKGLLAARATENGERICLPVDDPNVARIGSPL
jgi:hypothetical protein